MRKITSVIVVMVLCLLIIRPSASAVTGNFVGDGSHSYFSISMDSAPKSTALGTKDLSFGTFLNSNNGMTGTFETTGFTKDGTPLLFFDWQGQCPGGFFLTITPQPNNNDKLDVNVLSALDCEGEAGKQSFTMSRK